MHISEAKITFVGAGSMAEAMIRGLTDRKIAAPDQLYVFNRSDMAKLESLRQSYGVHIADGQAAKDEFVRDADIVVVAFKPKDAVDGLRALRSLLSPRQLLVSVIAGLSIETIQTILDADIPVVRTMPNTSSSIGLGATGASFSASVSADQREVALAMLQSIGIVAVVDEPLINMVNGVSGSGPAYIYYMMEAMIQGGVQGGLPENLARELTVQTVLGAANMVLSTGEEPSELRRKVTSPNGTTQAAIETMESLGFKESVIRAIIRCAERAGEMGNAINESAGAAVSHSKQK